MKLQNINLQLLYYADMQLKKNLTTLAGEAFVRETIANLRYLLFVINAEFKINRLPH